MSKQYRPGYYHWIMHPVGKREARRKAPTEKIQIVHEASRRIYGSPKVHAELLRQGLSLAVCRAEGWHPTQAHARSPFVGRPPRMRRL